MSVTICSLSVKWSSSVYSIVIYFEVSAWVAANICIHATIALSCL